MFVPSSALAIQRFSAQETQPLVSQSGPTQSSTCQALPLAFEMTPNLLCRHRCQPSSPCPRTPPGTVMKQMESRQVRLVQQAMVGAALEDDALASKRRRVTGSSVSGSSRGRLLSLRNQVSASRARPILSPAIDSSMRARHAGVCVFATVSKRAASHPGHP